jgi:hypothetical protein
MIQYVENELHDQLYPLSLEIVLIDLPPQEAFLRTQPLKLNGASIHSVQSPSSKYISIDFNS